MKKTLSICTLMLFAGLASAQTTKFGIKAGFTSAKLSATSGSLSSNTDAVKNFYGGVFAEAEFGQISFQPGLAYITKGGGSSDYAATSSTSSISAKSTLNFNYLELPLNVLYNVKLKPGKIFFGGGPYLAYGLSGTAKVEATTYNASGAVVSRNNVSEDVTWGSGTNDVKRFDVGLNALVGFRLNNGLELNLGLGAGLGNLSNDSSVSIKNQTLSAGLGYFFK